MKHTLNIEKESCDCNAQPALHPYMASESTNWFCRKFSPNNMARVGEIKPNRLHPSPGHHMEE